MSEVTDDIGANNNWITEPVWLRPVVLLLDTSLSMKGTRFELLRAATDHLINSLKLDPNSKMIDLAIVTFNNEATVVQEFAPVSEARLPVCDPDGESNFGKGLNKAFAILKQRYQYYYRAGIATFPPYMYIMTRGSFNDDLSFDYNYAVLKLNAMINIKPWHESLTALIFGIYGDANVLRKISEKYIELNHSVFSDFTCFDGSINWHIGDDSPFDDEALSFSYRIINDDFHDVTVDPAARNKGPSVLPIDKDVSTWF